VARKSTTCTVTLWYGDERKRKLKTFRGPDARKRADAWADAYEREVMHSTSTAEVRCRKTSIRRRRTKRK